MFLPLPGDQSDTSTSPAVSPTRRCEQLQGGVGCHLASLYREGQLDSKPNVGTCAVQGTMTKDEGWGMQSADMRVYGLHVCLALSLPGFGQRMPTLLANPNSSCLIRAV